MCQSYHSVICHELAHIETDECGAPEFASNGSKLLLAKGEDGKLTPSGIQDIATKRDDIHYPKPKVISITQSNEVGVVYSVEEIQAIKKVADRHNLKIHMDGARFANALVSIGCTPAEMTWKAGVDVLSFGGTKMVWRLVKPLYFSTKSWRKILNTESNKQANSLLKCGLFQPSG